MAPPFEPPLNEEEVNESFEKRFENLRYFRNGGQATLFLIDINDIVAVLKIYSEAHFVRAERECETLEDLESENVINLIGWGKVVIRDIPCIFTVTNFIQGQTLKEKIEVDNYSEHDARILGAQLAEALNSLWDLNKIVHRDIKPNNIIIDESGKAIVLDLGIAKHINKTTITGVGVSWGTHGYKSPEQASARKNLTFKSDFFALGIILYEIVTGEHPFNRRQDLIGVVKPRELKDFTDVSDQYSDLVNLLLEFDPLDRPKSFAHLFELLKGG